MTHHARVVLADCEIALMDLRASAETEFWRIRWVALVVLLRSVGHVLGKIDTHGSPEASAAITKAWRQLQENKPEPWIFWSFIEKERNNILKSYKMAVHMKSTVRPGTAHLGIDGSRLEPDPSGPTTFEYFFGADEYCGMNPIEACHEAILFWREYLDLIDSEAATPLL
jgi:hypothetical protein